MDTYNFPLLVTTNNCTISLLKRLESSNVFNPYDPSICKVIKKSHFAYILISYGLEGVCSSLSQVVTVLAAVCVLYCKQMQDDLKDKDTVLSSEITELISINIHIHEVVISEIFCRITFTFQSIGGTKSENTRIHN
jgi:hypothetical protein